jgi:hypothetical protein
MTRVLKILAVAVASLAGIAMIVVALLAYALRDMCSNDVVAEYSSPDASARVVVFVRNCGATTGFSTQASLLGSSTGFANSAGNFFMSDTDHGAAPSGPRGGPEIRVRWESPNAIVVEHHERARVLRAEQHIGRVNVAYKVFR